MRAAAELSLAAGGHQACGVCGARCRAELCHRCRAELARELRVERFGTGAELARELTRRQP